MRIQLYTIPKNINHNEFTGENKEVQKAEKEILPAEKSAEQSNGTASKVAIIALATVCSVFMLSRGFQKNTNKYLHRFKDFLEKRLAHSSMNKSVKWKNFYEFSIRRTNDFIKKSESINNITSLKDILFMKLMYKTKPTKKIHQAITKYFAQISRETVEKSYEKAEKDFNKMYSAFNELDKYILKNNADEIVEFDQKQQTKRELVAQAQNFRDIAKMAFDAFANKETIKRRYEQIDEVTSGLYSTFWDASFKDFWSKNNQFKRKEMWQTFIAAEHIKGDKIKIANIMSYMKNVITYTKKNEITNVYEYVKAIDNIIPARDKEGIEIVKRLGWYSKNPEIFENNKDLFFKELQKLSEHKITVSSDKDFAKTLDEYKQNNIDSIIKQVNDNRAGVLQDMLSIYYKIAPFELEESGAFLSLKRAAKSLEKSVDLESKDLFDKLRDLKLGSAPTDVLTILFSFVTLCYGFGHAKDNDKRTSIMLKSGIPIVGGIAAAIFTASKLISGGKSLAFGFLSGIILNRLGVIADNVRSRKKASENSQNNDMQKNNEN